MCKGTEDSYELAITPLIGKEQHFFYVCPKFFHANTTNEIRAITIAHEMTHDSADTSDECYGEINCMILSSAKAIKNAENYALFASAVHSEKQLLKKRKHQSSRSSNSGKITTKKVKENNPFPMTESAASLRREFLQLLMLLMIN